MFALSKNPFINAPVSGHFHLCVTPAGPYTSSIHAEETSPPPVDQCTRPMAPMPSQYGRRTRSSQIAPMRVESSDAPRSAQQSSALARESRALLTLTTEPRTCESMERASPRLVLDPKNPILPKIQSVILRVGHGPLIKSRLGIHNSPEGLVWCNLVTQHRPHLVGTKTIVLHRVAGHILFSQSTVPLGGFWT